MGSHHAGRDRVAGVRVRDDGLFLATFTTYQIQGVFFKDSPETAWRYVFLCGLIPTAVALATDYCFRALRLHRVEIAIRPENAASLRVVEKLGIRYEGRKPAYLNIAGAWRDHECFALHADGRRERAG